MHMNEQDRDGLAFFLSGEKCNKNTADKELEDNDILRRFLDPAVSLSSGEDNNGGRDGETVSFVDHNLNLKENSPTKLDFRSSSSLQEANHGRYDEEGSWALEANEPEASSYFHNNKLRDCRGRMNVFGSLENFLSIHGKKASRSFTKRFKDGDEQRSPTYRNSQLRMQRYLARLRSALVVSNFNLPRAQIPALALQSGSWIRDLRGKCHTCFRNHPVLFTLSLLLTLIVLSIWVS